MMTHPPSVAHLLTRYMNSKIEFMWGLTSPDEDLVRVTLLNAGLPNQNPLCPLECLPEVDVLVGGATTSQPSGTKIRLILNKPNYLTKDTARMIWQQVSTSGWEVELTKVA